MNLDWLTMNNFQEFVDYLETNMQSALDKSVSKMTKNILARRKIPWFTDEIRKHRKES